MRIVDMLGIGDQVRAKGHVASGGRGAMQNMTPSTAARVLGATQISEIKAVPETVLVGEYPAPYQVKTTYSAIILQRTERLDDAIQLTEFFEGKTSRRGSRNRASSPSSRERGAQRRQIRGRARRPVMLTAAR